MRALGLDVGSKTIGVAVGDTGLIASARTVLARRGQEHDARAVLEMARRERAGVIVVGMPLELDGREGHRARRVRAFVRALEGALAANNAAANAKNENNAADSPVTVVLWDERFSTAAAERTLLEADVSRAKRKQKVDALAAQFILQGWLDRSPNQRPSPNANPNPSSNQETGR